MIEFKIETSFNKERLEAELEEKLHNAQKYLDQQVLTDSNFYIPKDTGALEQSGVLETVIGSGEVSWSTDYARRQYYGDYKHNKSRNPNACRLWFEAAKARFLEQWRKLIHACFYNN